MKAKFVLMVILLLDAGRASAQQTLYKKVEVPGIESATTDIGGNLYVSLANGDVRKYAKSGDLLLEYSPLKNGTIKTIDATSQLKVVLFYEGFQEVVILDRYLSKAVMYPLADFDLGLVSDIAVDRQGNIWVVDLSSFSLSLLDMRLNQVRETKSLAQILNRQEANFGALKFHQGNLYLYDRTSGTYVFDNIGNYLTKYAPTELNIPSFYKDEVYMIGDSLDVVNLYDPAVQSKKYIPSNEYKNILYMSDQIIVITVDGFEIYR